MTNLATRGMDRLIVVVITCLILLPAAPAAAQKAVRIGTGGIAGTYYPVGRAIAELINRSAANCAGRAGCVDPEVVALPQLSSGTVANLGDLSRGRVEMALVQADQVPDQEDLPYGLVSALYGEAVHIVVAAGAPMRNPADLAGRVVSIDEEGSGTQANALSVLRAHGIAESGIEVAYYKPEFAARELRDGRLDAFFIVAGTPTPSVSVLASEHPIRLLPVTGQPAARMVRRYRYLSPVTIPAGTYAGVPAVETVGVEAYLVARTDLDARFVDAVMRLIWSPQGRRALVRAHRPIGGGDLTDAVSGKALSVHPGVRGFLEQQGIDPD